MTRLSQTCAHIRQTILESLYNPGQCAHPVAGPFSLLQRFGRLQQPVRGALGIFNLVMVQKDIVFLVAVFHCREFHLFYQPHISFVSLAPFIIVLARSA